VPDREARLIVLRHGATTWSGSGRFTGHQDPPLSYVGQEQARAAAAALARCPIRRIVGSDLQRARRTAEIVAEVVGLPVVLDRRLREEHLGQWEGLTTDETSRRFPDGYARWQRGDVVEPFDGREGLAAVGRRVLAAAADAVRDARTRGGVSPTTVLLVTHVNAAIALTGALTGVAPHTWPGLAGPEPGSWVELNM
jgi:glucosyl-3-phosphoglycerate phosphatase